MASLRLPLLTAIIYLVSGSLQQRDPLQNFCRRFGHQTTVIDNKLYIDGGLIDWNPISTYPQNYSSKSFPLRCQRKCSWLEHPR